MDYILITGPGGFIGSSLLNYVKENEPSCLSKIVLLSDGVPDHKLIIPANNYYFTINDFLEREIDSFEAVIHIGAFTPKDHASANLFDYNYSNITNTAHLLKNLPKTGKFIYISTADVYPPVDGSIDENLQPAPSSFYGLCKLFCEQMVVAYCTANNMIPQVLRLGNIYGRGESAYKKLIPETIRHILMGNAPQIYGTGHSQRSFLHVSDCVSAIWKAITLDKFIGPVNIVSSKHYTVLDLVQTLMNISEKALKISFHKSTTKEHDVVFNNVKMTEYLTAESIDIHDGLRDEYFYTQKNLQPGW